MLLGNGAVIGQAKAVDGVVVGDIVGDVVGDIVGEGDCAIAATVIMSEAAATNAVLKIRDIEISYFYKPQNGAGCEPIWPAGPKIFKAEWYLNPASNHCQYVILSGKWFVRSSRRVAQSRLFTSEIKNQISG